VKNIYIIIYGLVAYLFSFATLLYFLLFIGAWDFLPFHIDSGSSQSLISAVLINLSLAILFCFHHSIAARKSFKDRIIKIIHPVIERSTYVLVSGILLILLCLYWSHIDGYLWKIENNALRIVLISIYIFGWVFSTIGTFLINHFELFGLEQVYLNFKKRSKEEAYFTEKYFYKFIRHPIQLGTLIGIWFTPDMSYTHLMLSVMFTIYIFIGLYFEEKDLVRDLGKVYKDYQKRVSMIIPFKI